jgi:uncharacterized RDD family membrane protein YckC
MQSLRQHYERQDTEELLEIAKKDLTDQARTTLIQVMTERGIASSTIETALIEGASFEAKVMEAESRLAPRWKRVAAFAIDLFGGYAALFVLFLPLGLASKSLFSYVVFYSWIAYMLLRDSISKQSLGKRLLCIKVEQAASGKNCTRMQSVLRNAAHGFLFILDAVFALGERRRRLGDLLSGTVVVKSGNP